MTKPNTLAVYMVLALYVWPKISWESFIDRLGFCVLVGLVLACISDVSVVLLNYPHYSAPFVLVISISEMTLFLTLLTTRAFSSPCSIHPLFTLLERLKSLNLPELPHKTLHLHSYFAVLNHRNVSNHFRMHAFIALGFCPIVGETHSMRCGMACEP